MRRSLKSYFFLILLVLSTSCGNKNSDPEPAGDPETTSEFIRLFDPLPLPWQTADSSLARKDPDSLLIRTEVFTRFVPDSILGKIFGKNRKLRIRPLGKVEAPAETYLFAKTTSSTKQALLILAYSKKDELAGSLFFTKPSSGSLSQSVAMDKRHTITRVMTRKNNDGTLSEGKDVFVLNMDAGEFTLIMTESLDDKATEVINPIDTLARTHRYSADYSNGRMNLVSVRDGRKSDRVSFYIHFEKNNGECTGDLKGEAVFTASNIALYQVEGDPCVLQFTFGKNSVSLKEIEGCGARRGLQCSFDGSYAKKKALKAASK